MDELFELRNYFYLGNFPAAVEEGTTIAVESDATRIERDVILARAAIARGNHDEVIQQVSDSSPVAMQAVRLLAMYRKDPAGQREIAELTLREWVADPVSGSNPALLLVAAIVFSEAGNYDDALRCAHNGQSLEHSALKIQILLMIDRADAARKELEGMKRTDEDHTLTQLASAWVNLAAEDADTIREALYTYQELLERHGSTDLILNGIASCQLALKQTAEADATLQEAISRNPNCPETLINMITVAHQRQKPAELIARYFAQLQTVDPGNPWVQSFIAADALLSALVASPPV
ncbi:Coatomer subunit epsilon [Porphyridium purpureum]|uniref:Coatomer subunit epsilon n=1 Tax=Porphyridium purpureum TaxID=35688 RepID=A0A5J4YHA6_PORPP|nr:Coatomer subunit epsilon [Porphyridium purpureum]|eukprot:POR2332..scf251_18